MVSDRANSPPSTEAPSPSHRTTVSPSHPISPDDESLLHALSACNFNFFELAREKLLTLPQLITWASSEPIQHYIAELKKLARLTLELRHDQARTAAIDALEHVAKTTDDLTEKRRAATALLRKLDAIPQARQPDPLDDDDDDSGLQDSGPRTSSVDSGLQDSGPRTSSVDSGLQDSGPRTSSHPSLAPAKLISNSLGEAATVDELLATLKPHMAPDIKVCGLSLSNDPAISTSRTKTLSDFLALRAQHPRDWRLVDPAHDEGPAFNYTILMPDGARPNLRFNLGEFDGHWLLTTLYRMDDPQQPPDTG